MNDWSVSIHVRTRNRRGPTTTVGLHLEEPLPLSKRLILRNDPASGSTDLIADVRASGETAAEAEEGAFGAVIEATAVVGFAAGIGLVPERRGMVAVLPGSNGGPTQIDLHEGSGAGAEITVTLPISEIIETFARFDTLIEEDRHQAGALLELLSMGDQENSARARFLTYMTILDSLASAAEETAEVTSFIKEVNEAVKDAFEGRNQPETKALVGRLKERLSEVFAESTRSRLTRLFSDAGLGSTEAYEQARRLWKLRNDMSHGPAPIDPRQLDFANAEARELANLCLRHRFFSPARP